MKIKLVFLTFSLILLSCTNPYEKGENKTYYLWENNELLTVNYSWVGVVVTVGGTYSGVPSTNSIKFKIEAKDNNTIMMSAKNGELPLLFGNWLIGLGKHYIEVAQDGKSVLFADEKNSRTLTLNSDPTSKSTTNSNYSNNIKPSTQKNETIFGDYIEIDHSGYDNDDFAALVNEKYAAIVKSSTELENILKWANDNPNNKSSNAYSNKQKRSLEIIETLLVDLNLYIALLKELTTREPKSSKENRWVYIIKNYKYATSLQEAVMEMIKSAPENNDKKITFKLYPRFDLQPILDSLSKLNPTKYYGKSADDIYNLSN